jgi:hypothetical protein
MCVAYLTYVHDVSETGYALVVKRKVRMNPTQWVRGVGTFCPFTWWRKGIEFPKRR